MTDPTLHASELPAQPASPRRRRTGLVVVAVGVLVLALVGGTAVAAWRFLGSGGPQPADVLPADTLGVLSVDLDPSGGQKIEAVRALRSFPTFREEVGLEEGDDPLQVLFETLQEDEDVCPDLDYAADVAPWVGQRFAVAAVPGDDAPRPVVVVQVTDADAAREGAADLATCAQQAAGGSQEEAQEVPEGGFAVGEDYLVIAESEEAAQAVLDDGAEASLGQDEDFRRWSEEAGGAGIVSAYAAPAAAQALADLAPQEAAGGQLEDFTGGAATLRFDDGGVVLSGAVGTGQAGVTGGSVSEQVGSLPADTAAVVALSSGEESRARIREQLEKTQPGPVDDVLGQVEGALASVGLEFPDDVLTVLGDSLTVSVGGEAPESLASPLDVPAGIRVDGDPDAVRDVISRAEEGLGQSLEAQGVVVESDDDSVALSFQQDYAEQLLGDGSLGSDAAFEEVLPELSQSQALLFVRFDSAWRDLVLQDLPDEAARGDLEALGALGITGWNDDGATRFEARLSLDGE